MVKGAQQSKQSWRGFYPVHLGITGKKVLILAGTKTAIHEIERLVDFGAHVDALAPHIMAELTELATTFGDKLRVKKQGFTESEEALLKQGHYFMVFAYAKKPEDNTKLLNAAKQHKILACSIDDSHVSDFLVPAMLKRGHLKVSVSTDGLSPPLERAILQRIEANFVNDIDKYVLFLNRMREKITSLSDELPDLSAREMREVLGRLHQSEEIFLALRRNNIEEADLLVDRIINQGNNEQANEPMYI